MRFRARRRRVGERGHIAPTVCSECLRVWHSVSAQALASNASRMADILMIYIPGAQATAKRDDFSLSLSLDEQAADSLWEQNDNRKLVRKYHLAFFPLALGLAAFFSPASAVPWASAPLAALPPLPPFSSLAACALPSFTSASASASAAGACLRSQGLRGGHLPAPASPGSEPREVAAPPL